MTTCDNTHSFYVTDNLDSVAEAGVAEPYFSGMHNLRLDLAIAFNHEPLVTAYHNAHTACVAGIGVDVPIQFFGWWENCNT